MNQGSKKVRMQVQASIASRQLAKMDSKSMLSLNLKTTSALKRTAGDTS